MRFATTTIVFVFYFQLVFAQLSNPKAFSTLNSPYDELQPVLSHDRKTLFFTIGNHPKNIGGKKDPGDIWFSVFDGNIWGVPTHGGVLLNDKSYNAVAGISSDGNQLFLLGHYSNEGVANTQGISVSRKNSSGWSKPENISIPYFRNKSAILSGYISPDKGVFVFSADTYGTRGVEDIYVCLNEDGRWTAPRNLAAKINTQFQELSPSLSEDGRTLYYSSNGKKGKGSFDIYSANRLDDTWTNWSDPINWGSGINSDCRELFYRAYPDMGFSIYTSTKNSDGYGDMNVYRLPAEILKSDTIQNVSTSGSRKNTEELKTIKVYGKVNNAKTAEPVDATLNFSALAKIISAVSNTNGFAVDLPAKSYYKVKIEAQGFVSVIEKLDVQTYEMPDLEMNFKLQPIEIGTIVNLKNVLFERGTANLLAESNSELDLIVAFLNANPSIKIELNGHTDNRGVHSDNVKLSQDRVEKIKQYLISKGISNKRLTGKGFGGVKPVASNDTEETRKLNRRVEFTIKKF